MDYQMVTRESLAAMMGSQEWAFLVEWMQERETRLLNSLAPYQAGRDNDRDNFTRGEIATLKMLSDTQGVKKEMLERLGKRKQ